MTEQLTAYVEQCLRYAEGVARYTKATEAVRLYQNQAFGACSFLAQATCKEQPSIEAWIVSKWDEEWSPKFEKLLYEKGNKNEKEIQ